MTPDEEDLLRRLYPTASWEAIHEAFPQWKSRHTIYAYAYALGLRRVVRDKRVDHLDPLVAGLVRSRLTQGLPPKVVAERMGVDVIRLRNLERGPNSKTSLRVLQQWAHALGLEIVARPRVEDEA